MIDFVYLYWVTSRTFIWRKRCNCKIQPFTCRLWPLSRIHFSLLYTFTINTLIGDLDCYSRIPQKCPCFWQTMGTHWKRHLTRILMRMYLLLLLIISLSLDRSIDRSKRVHLSGIRIYFKSPFSFISFKKRYLLES